MAPFSLVSPPYYQRAITKKHSVATVLPRLHGSLPTKVHNHPGAAPQLAAAAHTANPPAAIPLDHGLMPPTKSLISEIACRSGLVGPQEP